MQEFDELLIERSKKGTYWVHFAVKPKENRRKVCFIQEGDSNPRYGNPYGSLANCWFQPLTHPSKRTLEYETVGLSP